ncbi:hypothetical protein JOM56_004040 [Amanita muscaria]
MEISGAWPRQILPTTTGLPTTSSSSSTSTTSSTDTTTGTGTSTGTTSSTTTSSSGSSSTTSGTGASTTSTTSGASSSTTSTSPSTISTTSISSTAPSSSTTNTLPSGVVTVTSTQVNANTPTSTPVSSSAAATSQGFFQNKAAVAGVFAVVGLIGAVILIALIVNCIRRRRAQEFDREIAEAAAEAAAVRAPAFLDDETENYGPGYSGASAYGKYSDVSHGTYSQPPMSEAYSMRQMGPGPGDIYDTSVYTAAAVVGAGAGAAGIGVARARSRRDFAAGLQEGTSPYPAFAGPQYNDMYNNSRTPPPDFRGGASPDSDADPVRRGLSQQTHQTGYSNMSRNRSANGLSSDGHSSQVPLALQPRAQRNNSVAQSPAPDMVPTVVEDPSPTDPLPNPFSAATETHDIEDQDESEEEEEQPRPVLRVANE